MKLFSIVLTAVIILFSASNISAQSCKNHLLNFNAQRGISGFQTHGSATVTNGRAGNKIFKVTDSNSHIYQDVKVPSGSTSVYIGGWTRNSKANATTGHAYLYGYVMDASGKILEYIQVGVQNKTTGWKHQGKTTSIDSRASKIRFFMKRSSINGQTDIGNQAIFDNVAVSFNCQAKTAKPGVPPCTNMVKNHTANGGETHWNTHGNVAVATLAGGNKSFKVMDSGAHFYQDITIPSGKRKAYIGGWTRNSQLDAPTGHAYLYGYVMDENDKILEYVQFGVTHTGMKWEYTAKTVVLDSNAKKIRLFLKKSAKNGVADTGNNAHFDNLVVSFDCVKKTPAPKPY